MRDAKVKGSVINIASIAGLQRGQLPGGIAYTASKSGVIAITRVTMLIHFFENFGISVTPMPYENCGSSNQRYIINPGLRLDL